MHLDEFVASETKRLADFHKHWMQKRETEPKRDWPLHMDEGDWNEQLQVYGWVKKP